ncbi:BUD13 -like protein [Trichinella zimbabwensis]|uniref:BUD13 homolog n=1 Tax=Trichinella zimbabwensis TaxID=268475 RepID=A0A0V1GZ40_9BILA|nr:BUD13 -like protein [Trichinella zimbabwensis]
MISKDEYLKRYISGETQPKKKKKKLVRKLNRVKIVEEEAFITVKQEKQEEPPSDEDKPVLALQGNKTDELRLLGKFSTSRWIQAEDAVESVENASASQENYDGLRRLRHDSENSEETKESVATESENFAFNVKWKASSAKQLVLDEGKIKQEKDVAENKVADERESPDLDFLKRKRRCSVDLSPPRRRRRESSSSSSKEANAEERCSFEHRKNSNIFADRRRRSRSRSRSECSDQSLPRRRHQRRHSSSSSHSPTRRADRKAWKSKNYSIEDKRTNVERRRRRRSRSPSHRRSVKSNSDESVRRNEDAGDDDRRKNSTLNASQPTCSDDNWMGRDAETVVRKKMTKQKKQEETEEQKQRREEMEKRYELWNKGVKQAKEREERLQDMAKEIDKPFARYEDDADLDEMLKKMEYEEDPMLEYIRRKKRKKNPELPKYKGPPPLPNRYSILPGVRWDGVDRSNGFESRLLSQANLKKAEQEELYKWAAGHYE